MIVNPPLERINKMKNLVWDSSTKEQNRIIKLKGEKIVTQNLWWPLNVKSSRSTKRRRPLSSCRVLIPGGLAGNLFKEKSWNTIKRLQESNNDRDDKSDHTSFPSFLSFRSSNRKLETKGQDPAVYTVVRVSIKASDSSFQEIRVVS